MKKGLRDASVKNVLAGIGVVSILFISISLAFNLRNNFGVSSDFLTASLSGAPPIVVTNTLDDTNPGSLRWAIIQANADPDFSTIEFKIRSVGLTATIQLTQALPDIKQPVLIDGWTQTGTKKVSIEIKGGDKDRTQLIFYNYLGQIYGEVRGLAISGLLGNDTTLNIHDNYIGLSLSGEKINTSYSGLRIANGDNSVVSDNYLACSNYASNETALTIDGSTNRNVSVKRNVIGLTITGQKTGCSTGIQVWGNNNGVVIGGNNPEDRNVISGQIYGGTGIVLFNTKNTIIKNNYIGLGIDGMTSNTDGSIGIDIGRNGYRNDDVLVESNFIAGYSSKQILAYYTGNKNVQIKKNIIGLNINKEEISGDDQATGIFVFNPDGLIIGGNELDRNVISGVKDGVLVFGGGNVKINHNVINTNNNKGIGVTSAINIEILGNQIYDNKSLGIDLTADGVTPNDSGDKDEGANHLVNYPLLESAIVSGNLVAIKLKLDIDQPSARVQFFANTSIDPSGYGEGEFFLGEQWINNSPSKTYTAVIPIPSAFTTPRELIGTWISATATITPGSISRSSSPTPGNTSEFSNNVLIDGEKTISIDFGDAPDSYSTLFKNNGPYHIYDPSLYLGKCIDFELDGQPNIGATGDDIGGSLAKTSCDKGIDEDGVTFPSTGFVLGKKAELGVTMTNSPTLSTARLNAWIDYDKNGNFFGQNEHVIDNLLIAGSGLRKGQGSFTVPEGARPGETYMRVRLSRETLPHPIEGAQSGEVEDYKIEILAKEKIGEPTPRPTPKPLNPKSGGQ